MLTVLIETRNDEDPLARTLATLVMGAVNGMVREVIVCDHGSTDRTHYVADHTGCRYLSKGGIGAGIGLAKGEWLIILEPGARLCEGWIDAVADHTAGSSSAARFTRSKNGRAGLFRRVFASRRPLADGLLITKRQAAALAQKAPDSEALARIVSAKRLRAEIQTAPARRSAQ